MIRFPDPFRRSAGVPLLILTVTMLAALGADACTTPVYEYALQRWFPDPYDVVLVHRGALPAAVTALRDRLQTQAEEMRTNLLVRDVDLAAAGEEAEALGKETLPALPAVLVHYPDPRRRGPRIWAAPFNEATVAQLLQTPFRKALAAQLTACRVPWVLLESGDAKQDAAAAKRLESELHRQAKTIKEAIEEEFAQAPAGIERPTPPAFPLLHLSRQAAGEALTVAMLMHCEPDLEQYAKEPIAFPVFGCGRALYALVGKGINDVNIEEACMFLSGPCACQVKGLNPGQDLLLSADWEEAAYGTMQEEDPLPPLTGVLPGPAEAEAPEATVAAASETAAAAGGVAASETSETAAVPVAEPRRHLGRAAVGIALGLLFLVAGLSAVVILLRRSQQP